MNTWTRDAQCFLCCFAAGRRPSRPSARLAIGVLQGMVVSAYFQVLENLPGIVLGEKRRTL